VLAAGRAWKARVNSRDYEALIFILHRHDRRRSMMGHSAYKMQLIVFINC